MIRIRLQNMLGILLGTALFGFTANYFNIANHLAEGGVLGIAILFKLAFGWDPGLMTLLMNIPLFFLGWKVLGLGALFYTIFGTVCLSGFLWIFGSFRLVLDDMMLASLFAGLGAGLGLGLIFRYGGTTGGVDILARVARKYFGWRIGRTMLGCDIVVLLAALVYLPVEQVMYTLVCVFVGARLIDFVQEAAYAAKAVTIVSEREDEISRAIMNRMKRGVTLLHGRGGYSRNDREVIFTVVGRSEIVKLKHLVRDLDPFAFMAISDANDVLGEGFTLDQDKKPIGRD